MAFPESLLPIVVELKVGSTWTDITSYVRYEQGIQITRGRADESDVVEPSTCTMTLDNRDGRFTPRMPTGAYFGGIGRNTPIRVSVDQGTTYLNIADTVDDRASTPDHASLDITGDLDVRIEARLEDWADADAQALVGKYDTTGQRSFRFEVDSAFLYLAWSTDGTTFVQRQSTHIVSTPQSRRLAVRATLDVDNGAAGHTVTFYTADSIDADAWIQLGDPVVTAGVTSIFSGTAPLDVGKIQTLSSVAPVGQILKAEVRNGINGTVVANPDFTVQTSGATSFADAAGRTWTVAGDATITNRRTRFEGEVSEWPPRWETGGFDVVDNIVAKGLLTRLGARARPLQSTLRRAVPTADPLAYWPLEDGQSARWSASPIPGVLPLRVTGFQFTGDDTLGGADRLPSLAGAATLRGYVPIGPSSGWQIEMMFKLDALPAVERTVLRAYKSVASGGAAAVRVRCSTAGIRVQILDTDDAVLAQTLYSDASALAAFVGKWNRLQMFSYDSGADWYFVAGWIDAVTGDEWYANTLLAGAGTVGQLISLRGDWGSDFENMSIGHLAVFDQGGFNTTSAAVTVYEGAASGFSGETAITRMIRVVEEGASDGTALFVYDGDANASSEEVGPQGVKTYLDILRDAEAADGGILYERRDRSALVYRDRATLYNQTPTLTLDYTGSDGLVTPIEPTDDDLGVANDVTIEREDGSFGRAELLTGAMSVLAPPNGIGRVDTSTTLNLHLDEQTEPIASWRLHLSTVDESRYPRIMTLLQKAPGTIDDATEVDVGDLIRVTNPPSWLPPDDIDLMVHGYTEYIDQKRWELDFACSPGSPWRVGGRDEPALGKRDTAGSELAEAVSAGETDVDVTTTLGPRWVTARPALNANPRVVDDLTGWTGVGSTLARIETPGTTPVVDGAWSIKATPDGVSATGGADSAHTGVGTVTPSTQYTASCWIYSPGGWSDIQACINWYDSADAYLSTSLGAANAVTAGVWTFLEQAFTAPASSSRASVRVRHSATPAATNVWYATQITIRPTVIGQVLNDFPVDVRVGGETMRAEGIYPSITDAFGRTASSAWGVADSGQTYTDTGGAASDYSVSAGLGRHSHSATNTPHNSVIPQLIADFDVVASVAIPVLATGASLFGFVLARYVSTTDTYYARLEVTTGAAVLLSIRKRVAGVDTLLSATYTTGLTHIAGQQYRVRFEGTGSDLRARAWLASATEPTDWQVWDNDTEFTAAGSVGVRTHVGSGNTNALPLVFTVDDFYSLNPQTFAVTRSISKAHAAGDGLNVWPPAVRAL